MIGIPTHPFAMVAVVPLLRLPLLQFHLQLKLRWLSRLQEVIVLTENWPTRTGLSGTVLGLLRKQKNDATGPGRERSCRRLVV